ncbi:hypothetical protein ACFXA3_31340 [Streptomyces sp. NPDC059456]|uniref:hypothetical protein n=1 Tax=Streptomyces sp. NPDC059456 TaxID=3346838 RepID=UPI0036AE817C
MSWNPQTDLPAPAPQAGTAVRRTRRRAGIAALLLPPALVGATALLLSTEQGSRCLVMGGCRPFPGELFLTLLGAVVAAFVVVQAAPHRLAKGAFAAQLALEALAVLAVLAYG